MSCGHVEVVTRVFTDLHYIKRYLSNVADMAFAIFFWNAGNNHICIPYCFNLQLGLFLITSLGEIVNL